MIGWTEHQGTRLSDTEEAHHVRAATIGAFFAGPPSIRKTSLHRFVGEYLLSRPDVPELLREGQACAGDATIKGHRTSGHA